MSNIIAIVWDFDKTLITGYMQDPLFKEYNIDPNTFWAEVNDLPRKYYEEQNVQVNRDTIYLNHILQYVRDGRFKKLNNKKLENYGKSLAFYDGIPQIFEDTKKAVEDNSSYTEYDIKVEHYVVSTGLLRIIQGSEIFKYLTSAWGCELIEAQDEDGDMVVSEIGYTIDNTSKTRALFEINKGTIQNEIDVNSKVPEELRRVRFENMIYIADGPSDIPAFSLVNKNGGYTFAIYPRDNEKAFQQVEKLRMDGRINMYAVADYSPGTTAYWWLKNKVIDIADRIRDNERKRFSQAVNPAPKHII